MPCKHEGGSDPCIRDKWNACKVGRVITSAAWYKNNRKHAIERARNWNSDNSDKVKRNAVRWNKANPDKLSTYNERKKSGLQTRATASDAGQAGEHLVAADLLRLGLAVTKPLNVNGAHDLHAKFSVGWKTIQVKLGGVYPTTGTINMRRPWGEIASDLFANVDIKGFRIRYIPRPGEHLPVELQ